MQILSQELGSELETGARVGASADDPVVIVPNLHHRYSGVTSTNRLMAPRLARRCPAVWLGPDAPAGIVRIGWRALLRLRRKPMRAPLRIWHARRNPEMILGVLLRALGWPLQLVFTSAAQRHHGWTTRWLIARMDGVIATSPVSASYLRRPATVILHGVDVDLYRPAEDRAAAWGATGMPGRFGIGLFGRVRHQKGTDLFVEAMCRLLPRHPDFTAVIIGQITPDNQSFVDDLRARIFAAGLADRIRILGELPAADLPGWFRAVSIFAFTSRNEGFGLTLLEAMASGAALVATRAGAAEVVVVDGETGLLVPTGDVEALAAALERLMGDARLREEMAGRARARVAADFSADREADEIMAFYEALWAAPAVAARTG